jgi:hypothetical protein
VTEFGQSNILGVVFRSRGVSRERAREREREREREMASNCVTVIVNNTQQVLDMKVGNSVYLVDVARLRRGAKHTMQVDYSDTYQEYKIRVLGSDGSHGADLVVTSDDCCDYKCITITEVDGKLGLQREPRVLCRSVEQYSQEYYESAPVPKRQCSGTSSWKFWIRPNVF